ncbi:carbamoyltransferase HypF [soil metagenome]
MNTASTQFDVQTATSRGAALCRRQWRVSGRVQGVGFRPFVYRIAKQHRLSGFVLNDEHGVLIEAQGVDTQLDTFDNQLRTAQPELASVRQIQVADVCVLPSESAFSIELSQRDGRTSPSVQISPDVAVCADCIRELRDRADRRRFGYGLVNCTVCGPRFSIIKSLPYDRPNTTMARFSMCAECKHEYANPADRRFHAQPIACAQCGPQVELVNPRGHQWPVDRDHANDPIGHAIALLAQGKIAAIKGIGGFHLAARADDEAAVNRLRQKKRRLHKPFAVMVADVTEAKRIVVLSDRATAALASPAAPIVLAARRPDANIAAAVAEGNHRLGVMLAYTPIHHLLFERHRFAALVMTSANDSAEPLVFSDDELIERLADSCDAILRHNRPIERAIDDSVILDRGERDPLFLRRSRGYVQAPLALPPGLTSSGLAVGGELKNTVAIVRGGEVILSQHLGDLGHARSYARFKQVINDLLQLYSVKPQWIACDMHPTYVSSMFATELARTLRIPRIALQHHYAHAAAVLAEHQRSGPALAVVCDGTGYGADHTTWGGELLKLDLDKYERLGHLRRLRLPGGDAAAKQTWRAAVAMLFNAFGADFVNLPIVSRLMPDAHQAQFVGQMILNNASCAMSSSAGRVFDGVAAILGLCGENHFEAQAAMALESAASTCASASHAPLYRLNTSKNDAVEIDLSPFVRELVERGHASVAEAAAQFQEQFIAAWEAAVLWAVRRTGVTTVALSGGTFCNEWIDAQLAARLARRGLDVLRHRRVPPNDGGLALGQAALAAQRAANGFVPA